MAARVTVKEAARLTGMSELTIRWGIINGTLDIGGYVKKPGSQRTTYYISPEKLARFIGRSESNGRSN